MAIQGVNNKNLFSNHYLENLIQKTHEWGLDEHEAAFDEIKKLYESVKPNVKNFSEAQLSTNFFEKIFGILNIDFIPQAKTEGQEFPDYAFYPNKESMGLAYSENNTISKDCMSICEVKKWEVRLDKRESSKKVRLGDPSHQIFNYLAKTEKPWGILSNGHKWRIFKHGKYMDIFYEIDLVQILDANDKNAFRYFYYFFRREAFIKPDDGDIFLERIFKGSVDFAKVLGDDLKDKVYQAMKLLADGFLDNPENKLDKNNPEELASVQQSTMRLLYRLLFLLYAEGKGLLDTSIKTYKEEYSFWRLKNQIKENEKSVQYLWADLIWLFNLINYGSEGCNIPKGRVFIPPYNGGLFSPEKNPNLKNWQIDDGRLIKAIKLLSIDQSNGNTGFIDYSSLDIRHLGGIYEGLLEFKLKIADEDLVVSGGKKSRVWKTLEEHNKTKKKPESFDDFDEFSCVRAGDVYLATDKGERKATGSYYTPDYIVEYIVENTVGPVIEEKWKEAEKSKASFVEATLSINVLDPAMGSGHFLVGATEFLATKLMDAVDKDIEAGLLEPSEEYNPHWAKREVVSHSIYGVDLNEMAVELAKLSLWLTTISQDKPLSFLDHRLKHGNSLIGANMVDLPWHPKKKRDKTQKRIDIPEGFIKKFVETIDKLDSIDDDSLDNIKQKEKIFQDLKNTSEYDKIKTLADVRTSIYFGNEIDNKAYGNYTARAYYDSETQWAEASNFGFARTAKKIAYNNTFFHWELEFPEVFFKGGQAKDNPGFDAVIGNPPYVNIANIIDDLSRKYLQINYKTVKNKSDLYSIFTEKSCLLLRHKGTFSFIFSNSWLGTDSFSKFRKFLVSKTSISTLVRLPPGVFEDANVTTTIIVLKIEEPPNNHEIQLVEWNGNTYVNFNHSLTYERINSIETQTFSFEPEIKLKINTVKLGDIADFSLGIKTSNDKRFIHDTKIDDFCYKVLSGKEIGRYYTEEPKKWIWYKPELMMEKMGAGPRKLEYFLQDKIFIQDVAKNIIAYYDEDKYLSTDTLSIMFRKNDKFDLKFIIAILNSKFMNWYFKCIFPEGLHIKINQLQQVPIPNIKLAEQRLLIDLAIKMIDMNKEKQKEIKGFREWLEGYIGVSLDDLQLKTKLKGYYNDDWEVFKKALEKNNKNIEKDISRREHIEKIKEEFDSSMQKLAPLMKTISDTDDLIDEIVYKLYGLTEEEIGIVEGKS